MNVVYVELDRCIACLSCVQVCLFQQGSRNTGWSPNIFVHADMERRRIYAGTCLQCEPALCMEVCAVDAIKRDPQTGAVLVDREICVGCGMCISACPFGYMHLEEYFGKASKCDLCGGNPVCVQMCMAKALHFGSLASLAERKRNQTDLRLGLRAIPVHKGEEK
jgi:carbon-monoxide dehydrogenase iron sulfur subunit